MDTKSKLMIVDDAEINRQILMEILGDGYEYVQAEDGREAVHILQQDLTIDLMLLDINMPHMDGLQVLEQMKKFRWIREIPVIMISSEERRELMERAYGYGAQDYIRRPFDAFIVRQRVKNALDLYRTQKHLKQLVSEQIYEKEKNNNLIIGILSHVVEFRNSETSEHILRIRTVTELLLRKLVQKTDEYHLSDADISMITTASALHDIGKINIPEAIINKPGRLTKDEFEIMKTHAAIGGDIILKTSAEKENPLLRVAWQICRWHHERWDGHGYPDGLRGEEIPITAQVVAVADVYDALTSKRCYKDAYAHQTALDMILDGECGSFNPLLLECLQEIAPSLLALTSYDKEENAYRYEADQLAAVILDKTDTSQSNQAQSLLNSMQEKADFLASVCGGIQFSYDVRSGLVDVVDWNKPPKYRHSIIDAFDMAHLHKLSQEDLSCLREAIESTTPENREFAMSVTLKSGNGDRCYDLHARTLWSELSPGRYVEVVGQLSEPDPTSAGIPILDGLTGDGTADGKDLKMALKQLTYVFDIVRLVDPMDGVVLELDDEGILRKTDQHCAAFWENGDTCGNCISTRALLQKTRLNKLEFTRNDMYYVASKYLCIKGIPCVLEMLSKMDEGRWIDANGTRLLINKNSKETRELFLDPVTGAYSRRYLESYLPHLEGMECVDIIDVDKFKHVNDIYGHIAGDMVLREIVAAIQSCIRSTDILVRYGGDEFLLLFPKLTEEQLSERNKKIQGAVEKVVIPEYPGLHLSVSIGGVCDVHPLKDAIAQADKRMYQDKERGK